MSESLGEWVRHARARLNLNQEKLGDLLGVTKANVSAWERSRHEPSFGQMLRLSELSGALLPIPVKQRGATWPLSSELLDALVGASPTSRLLVENVARAALGLPPLRDMKDNRNQLAA